MAGTRGIEAVVSLEVEKKDLPFLPEAVGYVVPKTLDTGVVYTPTQRESG